MAEIGGAPALSETTRKLTRFHTARHSLTAKLAFHLTTRYLQIQAEGEPSIEEMDLKTGKQKQVLAKEFYPDIFERQMLRRQQANEYFVPVNPLMLEYLKSHLSQAPDDFIPIAKRVLFEYIDLIPTT